MRRAGFARWSLRVLRVVLLLLAWPFAVLGGMREAWLRELMR